MTATLGYGTKIKIGDGAGTAEVFTEISGVIGDIKGPMLEVGQVEVTAHDSTSGYREYLPTLIEPGEIGFSVNFDPNDVTHSQLRDDAIDKTLRNFQVVWPDAEQAAFTGYVTKFSKTAGMESAIVMEVTIKISGVVTYS